MKILFIFGILIMVYCHERNLLCLPGQERFFHAFRNKSALCQHCVSASADPDGRGYRSPVRFQSVAVILLHIHNKQYDATAADRDLDCGDTAQ